jgi:hypothetical protein
MEHLYQATTVVAFCLYVYLLTIILRGHLRPYWALFTYLLILLFTVLIDATLVYAKVPALWGQSQGIVFFTNDLIRQGMVYLLVISLIFSAVRGSERFRWLGRWLVLGAILLAVFFVWFHEDEKITLWMTNVIRNLSLVAMLMNLLLWVLLMKKRTADRMLLLVTTGLGLQMAGEAMGQSLRLMAKETVDIGNAVLVLAHLCCLAVWFLAFKPRKQAQQRAD